MIEDVLIVGAGLAGLMAAQRVQAVGKTAVINGHSEPLLAKNPSNARNIEHWHRLQGCFGGPQHDKFEIISN
ncbi:hypothetical protein MNBD_CHLOROFLEXI01-347 [hydrothermal vent metagenome]|uniref:FAD-dependent oxidoreductase 2 FAD-binding domain-containing protein n=1 Tax=hydrothermal vent metagenome TaxID=652676 RepID=A0A3B0W6G4_9ZZZZ